MANGTMNGHARPNNVLELLDKPLPADPHSELMLLRSLLLDGSLIDREHITAEHFHDQRLRAVFVAIADLREDGKPVDTQHVYLRLKEIGRFDEIGGGATIGAILTGDPIIANTAVYLRAVREAYARRKTLLDSQAMIQAVYADRPIEDLLSEARERLDSLAGLTAGDDADDPDLLFERITAAQLATTTTEIDYHIPGLLVAGQPQGIFGHRKSLKTSVALDLAVSLTSGRPFLSYFRVERTARVGIFSGESGRSTIEETLKRICVAAGVELERLGIVYSGKLPKLADPRHLAALEKWIARDRVEVLIIDPIYLSLDVGGREGSIFAMGAALQPIGELCQRLGVTLLICHHMKKGGKDQNSPGDLDDISYSGFAEFVRGWILLTRRESYVPGTGRHELWLSVGGSAGHSGLWGIDIFEGIYNGPGTRVWDVEVIAADDLKGQAAEEREKAKEENKARQVEKAKREIVNALATFKDGETEKAIRDTAGVSGTLAKAAFAALLQDKQIVPCEVMKGNRRTPYEGYKLNYETT